MNKKINVPDDFAEIHLIPYMHTDYSWTNSRPWHIRRYTCGLGRALEIMRTDPDFTYVIDNVHHSFSVFEKYCPELMPEFEKRVKEAGLSSQTAATHLQDPTTAAKKRMSEILSGDRDTSGRALIFPTGNPTSFSMPIPASDTVSSRRSSA